MRAVLQRVSKASVIFKKRGKEIKREISRGLLVFIAFVNDDNEYDIEWISKKIIQLRIFSDSQNKMNLSLKEINGEILLISQFTLMADTKKGNRPSFIRAANADISIPLYNKLISTLSEKLRKEIKTGEFGADMKVNLCNDGPVTIIIDSKNKKI